MNSKSRAQELFWISFLSLFLELLVIRWLSADVRAFSVLKSFPLATCFVGLGIGLGLGKDKLFQFCPLAILLFVLFTKFIGETQFCYIPFPSERLFDIFWISKTSTGTIGPLAYWLFVAIFMAILTILLAGPFFALVSVGSRLGVLFNQMKPLHAYCINLSGALLGTVVFGITSFLNFSPYAQLLVTAAILLVYLKGANQYLFRVALPVVVMLIAAFVQIPKPNAQTYWSPYERLDLITETAQKPGFKPIVAKYRLQVNRYGQQFACDFSSEFLKREDIADDVARTAASYHHTYSIPYCFLDKHPDDVLILASGLGNDIASSLMFGAKSIDAVEIDPVTLKLGNQYHPLKPYESPKVNAVCDDARHFLRNCKKHYDLIVFSFLDSMTVLSQSSAVRLDNFVYTKQSVQGALRLLKPDGLLLIQYYAKEPWFTDRLYWTMADAAGYKPCAFGAYQEGNKQAQNIFLLLGEPVKNKKVMIPASQTGFLHIVEPDQTADRILSDDWPYLYLAPVTLDFGYLIMVAEVLALTYFAGRKVLWKKTSPKMLQMLFLGAGFLLLELQSISRLSLLYGATWLTSSVVISGVMIELLIANVIVLKYVETLRKSVILLYSLLIASILISYLLPVGTLLDSQFLGSTGSYFLVTFFTLLPMFMAALIFGIAFERVDNAGTALGFNSIGAVLGALLEYLTGYCGINNMVLIAGVLYALSLAVVLPQLTKLPYPDPTPQGP